MRVPGDNSDGFRNEIDIEKSLDFKLYEQLNPNLQYFLQDVFKGYSLTGKRIHAIRCRINVKPDFYLSVDGVPSGVYVSVKKGSGNSVHQESLYSFVEFIEDLGASGDVINALKLFHYGDGTINNTGNERLKANEFAKNNPEVVKNLNKFFSQEDIEKKCIERFLFTGKIEDAPIAQYIYHGTAYSGVWASREEILKYVLSSDTKKDSLVVNIGPLSYQVWNRNLNFNKLSEYKREQMQIKWSSLNDVLTTITSLRKAKKQRGTEEGTLDEIASVVFFNRDPQNTVFAQYLRALNKNPEDTLLVRVTSRQFSKLSGQKVMTRADAYAIEVKDERLFDVLEENEFYLDETILLEYEEYYVFVPYSGISIKLYDSKDYQLLKLTPNSFEKMFGSYVLGAGASLFCQNEDEISMNLKLLQGWNTSVEGLKQSFPEIEINEELVTCSIETCKQIKKASVQKITFLVESNEKIQKMIFNGQYIYEEPYAAYYFMKGKTIYTLRYIKYLVTTGSGRSKGIYTLVFKPR